MISYEFNESNPVEFGIVVNHLKDMTKAMTVKDKHTLLIEYDLENPTWLVLTSCGVKKNLRLLKSSMMKRHKTPNFDSLWSAKIPYKQIIKIKNSNFNGSSHDINSISYLQTLLTKSL